MGLDDVKDSVPEQDTSAGMTTFRVSDKYGNMLKREAGVSQNKQAAPLVEAAIAAYVGDEDEQEDAEERFTAQFEDE